MQNTKGFWCVQMGLVALLYGVVLFHAGALFPCWPWAGPVGVVLMMLFHASEIPIARKALAGSGIPRARQILLIVLFGYTWWGGAKRGVLG
ncbi:MAG TPA: hypothetical protein PKM65_18785 [Spirochaetota bacterium]|nr:hypothetical protein [Spirochaetota bacterium]HNT11443.1 hypothetical protein [Spirochaetota bacterium]HNV49122.1 hypothetical protein [Spirochaetota bacterium]HOS40298.1 hypothetical protein [Spirochaetota bacterium]HPU89801.1 hypothetical protein [Spirochaetota bacterium]